MSSSQANPSTETIVIMKDFKYYLELTNWKLKDEVLKAAYETAFPILEDRLKFISDQKNFYEEI